MNNISIVGTLVKKPEYLPSGKGVRFTVGVSRPGDRSQGDFFDCVSFGQQGATLEKYLDKGSQIAITGRMQQQIYKERKQWTLIVGGFTFIRGGKGSSEANSFTNEFSGINDYDPWE